MRFHRRLLAGTLAAPLAFCAVMWKFAVVPDRSHEARDLERKTEAYLLPYVEMDHFAGIVLLARGEEILVHVAMGLADRELGVPFTTDTRLRLGSITKDFTAALVLSLRDEGLLALDDPLSRFLADFPNGDRIFIRHLLEHTHGVPNWRGLPNAGQLRTTGMTIEQATQVLAGQPLDFEPGTRRSYGSSGYLLLARVIEEAAGASYVEVLTTRLLEPLGLEGTGSLEGLELVERMAESYVPVGRPPWLEHPLPEHPAITVGSASMFSNAKDLFTWSRSEEARRLGWGESEWQGRRMLWTSGLTHGFMSRLHRFPDADVTLVFLTNIFTPAFRVILDDLTALMFGEPVEPPEAWRPVSLSSKDRASVSGSWACDGPWEQFSIESEAGQLWFEIEGNRFPLIPRSPTLIHLPTDYAMIFFSDLGPDGFRRARYEGGFTESCTRGD